MFVGYQLKGSGDGDEGADESAVICINLGKSSCRQTLRCGSELALNEVNGVTREPCHAEHIRSAQCQLREASRGPSRQTLRYAQGDKKGPPSLSGTWTCVLG